MPSSPANAPSPKSTSNAMPARKARSSLRILVVCAGNYVSGAEIVALSVMKGLQDRGHRIRCITSAWNDGDFPARLDQAEIPYLPVRLGSVSKSLQPKYLWWTINALVHLPKAWFDYWQECRRFQPDVILFNSFVSASLLRPLLDERRTVFYAHELPLRSLHFRRCLEIEASFIAVSEYVKERLVAQGISEESVSVVYNGLALPPDTPPPPHPSYPIKIGIAGQVGAWKGHDNLIDALRLLDEEARMIQCHIIGRGDDGYSQKLKQKIERYALTEQVVWRGFQRNMAAVYRELDLLVVPSRHEEPFGLVAAEAGLHGLPVIASRRGGLPEIVDDGETGYLVDAEAPDQIADRLERLIRNPELRARMGIAGRARVASKFTRSGMLDGIENALYSVERKRADCAGQFSFD